VDVTPFLEASLEHFYCRPVSLAGVAPSCVCPYMCFSFLFALVCPLLMLVLPCSRLVLCSGYLATCALLGRCFVVVAAWVDALPLKSLPSHVYFVTLCLRILCHIVSTGCFAAVLFSVDTLPPRLHLPCWQPRVVVSSLQVQSFRLWQRALSLPRFLLPFVFCVLNHGLYGYVTCTMISPASCKLFFRHS
jgi:hypothetical protein